MSTPHKHAAAIKAWADGATIQVRRLPDFPTWVDCGKGPLWQHSSEYRVKPPREFPTTSLSDKALYDILNMVWKSPIPGESPMATASRAHRTVADAAIKQYILDQEASKP